MKFTNSAAKILLKFYMVNFFTFFIIGIYLIFLLSVIEWGLPGYNHPFPYHMDEWHQLEFVKNVFSIGTVDKSGATQIPMFHFLLTGVLVSPFYLFGYVNPFLIDTAISSISEQHKLFVILRLTTLLFGSLSIFTVVLTGRKYFNTNAGLSALLFTVNPVWLSLSNYFKYDIALVFWITLTLLLLLRIEKKRKLRDYMLAGCATGLAVGTKISAAPLLLFIPIGSLLFEKRVNFRKVFGAYLAFLLTFLVLGVPDIFLRFSNYVSFTAQITQDLSNANEGLALDYPLLVYIFIKQIPTSFGYPFYFLFLFSIVFQTIGSLKRFIEKKEVKNSKTLILVGLLIFIASLAPLKLESGSNRILVLLPFLALLTAITLKELYTKLNKFKFLFSLFLSIVILVQFIQSITWVFMRYTPPVQERASKFIIAKYESPTTIGIESIPIYQLLPDIAIKNYYNKIYKVSSRSNLEFQVVDASTKSLPDVVIVTNDIIFENFKSRVPKKELLERLEKEGYKKVNTFTPNLILFRYFGNYADYYLSGLLAEPISTSIYQK